MHYSINRPLFLVLVYSLFSPLWAQESMDFYWTTFASGYGFTQSEHQIELYKCDDLTKNFSSVGKVQLSDHYSPPSLWAQKDEHLYGFSTHDDFVRVHRINWHTKESKGARILHPELSALFDQQSFFIPQGSEDGVVLISPKAKSLAVIDFEANEVYYSPIPQEIALDSLTQLTGWLATINPKLGQSTYAYRGIDLMRDAYSIIGLVLLLFLTGVGLFFFTTRRTFRLTQKELSNRFKKIPLTVEMYHFLKHLAQYKMIRNQTALDFFQKSDGSIDAKIKRKNKMVGDLSQNIYDCFKMNFYTKEKDRNDAREVIYKLASGITIKVSES
jgi:DNA-binding MarR family transcriptional regulator